LYRHLSEMARAIEAGERDYPALVRQHLAQIEAIGFRPDYLEVRHAQTLLPAQATDRDLVILVAAFLGATRLIDNVHLNLDSAL
ncbi:MAG: pantoate--beta-alanine ligase, partial [Pseudomonas sp.]|nr:pantoate--beta-alanine ligase [Pseudomonas sp.]